jgi:hypothetical protein
MYHTFETLSNGTYEAVFSCPRARQKFWNLPPGAFLVLTEPTQNQGKLLPSTSIITYNIYNLDTG